MAKWHSVRPWVVGIGLIIVGLLVVALLVPSVERTPRIYYQGRDQFYWGNRLGSKIPAERQEAATALASLLKSNNSNVRIFVIQYLGNCRQEEREIALPALLSFAKNEQEEEYMRWKAQYAIGIMFFQHVFGELPPEVDREPYEKKILTNGCEAVEREVADEKAAKNKGRR